ncbi:MAG: S46 family peptidase, partial [Bacteroidetes bacterium]|nr:S46 family peptidase [Bacteroidota bacterium]
PIRITLRGKRLEAINRYMNQNPLTRLGYVAKAATIANGWKKWQGELNGLKRLHTLQNKREHELDFQAWVFADQQRKTKYQHLLKEFENTYKAITPLDQAAIYYTEAGQAIEMIAFVNRFGRLISLSRESTTSEEQVNNELDHLKEGIKSFFNNYNPGIDQEIMPFLLREYASNTDPAYRPAIFASVSNEWKGDYSRYTFNLFRESVFTSEEKITSFLNSYKRSKYKKLLKDPFYKLAFSINEVYAEKIQDQLQVYKDKIDSLQRIYTRATMEMSPGKRFYPDANLTLRVAYGRIMDYHPKDAVDYQYFTSLKGVMEKEDETVYDLVVNPVIKKLYQTADFGPYADKDGELHTCFIASNHTSGGNSGSPVFNGDGQLIGINFDRNWEGTMSDINYDPEQCRNITVDIRYCLFVMDKVCGAGHLLKEMTLVR